MGRLYILYPSSPVGDVVCPSSVDVHGIPWPVAIPGKYVHADCSNGKEGRTMNLYLHCSIGCKIKKSKLADFRNKSKLRQVLFFLGNASRLCDNSGAWMKTRVSYCADIELSSALNEV